MGDKGGMMENILISLTVKKDTGSYFGEWKNAIDDAYELSKKLGIGCELNYANQYKFIILPDMDCKKIEDMKNTKVVIGL